MNEIHQYSEEELSDLKDFLHLICGIEKYKCDILARRLLVNGYRKEKL